MIIVPFYIASGWTVMLLAITILCVGFSVKQWTAVLAYSLPIPRALMAFSPVVSIINLIAQPVVLSMLGKYTNDPRRNAFKILGVAWLALLSFDIVIATRAFDHLSGQDCPLAEEWKTMFSQKSTQIKVIQESFQCCGFMTTKDRAYPFPDAHNTATACIELYGYTAPCAPALENANHVAAMTFFLVVLSSVVLFAYVVILYKTGKALYPEIFDEFLGTNSNTDARRVDEPPTEETALL